jgi:hypothetical protein
MMKKILLIASVLLLFFLSRPIRADTIIDSVYSVPELDGNMCYTTTGQFWSLNAWTYAMKAGDLGDSSIPVSPPSNSTKRAFISFELPEIITGYEIDSVSMRLYQFDALGGYPTQYFPVWNVAGGDTIKCILNHIDYGFELDPGDWEKGDVGNPYTFTHNAGTVTESGEDGYRYLDVTDCILYDYQQERTLTQYRISFQIDTDLDDHPDFVAFSTADSWIESYWPNLFFYLSNGLVIENVLVQTNNLNCKNFPNPFNPETKIQYELSQNSNVMLQIFNVEGQLIETIVNEIQTAGRYSVIWDASNQSSGIYFYKIKTGIQTATGKCLLLK